MHLLAAQPGTISDGGEAVDLGQSRAISSFCRRPTPSWPALPPRVIGWGLDSRAFASPTCCNSAITCRSISTSKRSSRMRSWWSSGCWAGRAIGPMASSRSAAICRAGASRWRFAGRRPAGRGADAALDGGGRATHRLWRYCRPRRRRKRGGLLRYRGSPGRDRRVAGAGAPDACRHLLAGPGPAGLDDLRRRWKQERPSRPSCSTGRWCRPGNTAVIDALIAALDECRPQRAADLCYEPQGGGAAATRRGLMIEPQPSVILNATAFAISQPGAARTATPFDGAMCRCCRWCSPAAAKRNGGRDQGLSARDLAMQVALPEVDGRSYRPRRQLQGGGALRHGDAKLDPHVPARAGPGRVRRRACGAIGRVCADSGGGRRVAIVLANYPNRDGRLGNGVGLDTPAGVVRSASRACRGGLSASPTLPADAADDGSPELRPSPTICAIGWRTFRNFRSRPYTDLL